MQDLNSFGNNHQLRIRKIPLYSTNEQFMAQLKFDFIEKYIKVQTPLNITKCIYIQILTLAYNFQNLKEFENYL